MKLIMKTQRIEDVSLWYLYLFIEGPKFDGC